MPLSIWKTVMEFLAAQTCSTQKEMYTKEKKTAIRKALISFNAEASKGLACINNVRVSLEKKTTLAEVNILDDLNVARRSLSFVKQLNERFLDELNDKDERDTLVAFD